MVRVIGTTLLFAAGLGGCAIRMYPYDYDARVVGSDTESQVQRYGPTVTRAQLEGDRIDVRARLDLRCRVAQVDVTDVEVHYAPKPARIPTFAALGGGFTTVALAGAGWYFAADGENAVPLVMMVYSLVPAVLFDVTLIRTLIRSSRVTYRTERVFSEATEWEVCGQEPYGGAALARISPPGASEPVHVVTHFGVDGVAPVPLASIPSSYWAAAEWDFGLEALDDGLELNPDPTPVFVTGDTTGLAAAYQRVEAERQRLEFRPEEE